MSNPRRRTARRGAITALTVLVAAAMTTPHAYAVPTPEPSGSTSVDQQLNDLNSQAADVATAVAQLDSEIAALDQQVADAEVAVQVAGENYTQALADLDAAKQAVDESAARLADAQDRQEASRAVVLTIAREYSRGSNAQDELQVLFTSTGLADAVASANTYSLVSTRAQQAVQQYNADSVVAETLKEVNEKAVADLQVKEQAASDTLATAEQQADAANQLRTQSAVQRDSLLDDLAGIRNTSRALESQRQDELAQQRQDAIERQAQQQVQPTVSASQPAQEATSAPQPEATQPAAEPAPAQPAEPVATSTPAPQQTTEPAPAPVTPTPTPTPTPAPAPTTSPAVPSGGVSRASAEQGQEAVRVALTRLGTPYLWGGTGVGGYDCSGLTSTSWSAAGVSITRTSRSQYQAVAKIPQSEMRAGDLIFWATNTADPSTIYHVAMYIGDGQMVEAPSPGKTVRVTSIRYANIMTYAGRP